VLFLYVGIVCGVVVCVGGVGGACGDFWLGVGFYW